ncbi:hypothetical protein EVAR_73900_1 [Eumeta japonica]|uniref:Uncharacterized protein n=1 Tax=Eumeta variegata TaxID=151549 RepID=A0A4C1SZU7_EUMVA|nr:hypothetical protein EVAR_73900_1 [Eumeta japonica]
MITLLSGTKVTANCGVVDWLVLAAAQYVLSLADVAAVHDAVAVGPQSALKIGSGYIIGKFRYVNIATNWHIIVNTKVAQYATLWHTINNIFRIIFQPQHRIENEERLGEQLITDLIFFVPHKNQKSLVERCEVILKRLEFLSAIDGRQDFKQFVPVVALWVHLKERILASMLLNWTGHRTCRYRSQLMTPSILVIRTVGSSSHLNYWAPATRFSET